jgi:ribosome-binding protein aMBF1 (putative translation factor)
MLAGKDIKIARVYAGKKAIDLAKELKITPSKLSLIENGYINCDFETEEKVRNALKIQKCR